MIIDLTTASNSVTATGGIFGDIDGNGNTGIFSVYGLSGLLDTQTVAVADMGAGNARTFFGWTTIGGEVITKIEFYLAPDAFYASVDDFQFGTVTAVPVPAAIWLFGSGLLGLVGLARSKLP